MSRWSHWTIGRKIAAGFLLVLFQALSVGVYALWMTAGASAKLGLVASEYMPEMDAASRFETEILNARIHFIYFVTIQKEGALDKGKQRFLAAQQQLPKLQDLVNRSEAFAPIRPDVDQLRRDLDNYQAALEKIIGVVQRNENQSPEFPAMVSEWARLGGRLVDSAGRLSRRGSELVVESARQASSGRATLILAGACVSGLLFGVLLTFLITRSISATLRTAIAELSQAAGEVAGASLQIAKSSQSLSQGASEQAASLEQTSASSEEINSMASRNAEHSRAAAGNMAETSQRIEEANRNLDHMVGAMNQINASSSSIAKIIKVIDEIAFQTNILALNAAVEAARAGQAGLGFAVVADEVRSLAQRCAQAAQDTTGLIEESIARSVDGQGKLTQVTSAVQAITESTNKVKTLVDEVKVGSQEQSRGIEEVARAILQMQRVTHTAAATAEQSAAAGEQLSTQSETLRTIVAHLRSMAG